MTEGARANPILDDNEHVSAVMAEAMLGWLLRDHLFGSALYGPWQCRCGERHPATQLVCVKALPDEDERS